METPVVPVEPPSESASKNNMLAITSLATGVLGIVSTCIGTPVMGMILPVASLFCVGGGGLLGLAGLITGILAQNQIKNSAGTEGGRGMATGGIVTSAITLGTLCILPIITIVALMLLGPTIGNVFSEINNSLQNP
jgi:hypothetical protein